MEMSINEAIQKYAHNAEYERTHGNLQGCLEFRHLAGWLMQLRNLEQKINECGYALHEVEDVLRKYQKIQEILNSASYVENGTVYSYTYDEDSRIKHIREVVEDGNED